MNIWNLFLAPGLSGSASSELTGTVYSKTQVSFTFLLVYFFLGGKLEQTFPELTDSEMAAYVLDQGSSNLSLEVGSAAEFSSNPDQTPYLWLSNDLEDAD